MQTSRRDKKIGEKEREQEKNDLIEMNRCEEQREREREEKTAQRTYDIFFSCALSRALFFFSLFLSYASTRVGKKKKVKRNDDAEHEPQRASIIV